MLSRRKYQCPSQLATLSQSLSPSGRHCSVVNDSPPSMPSYIFSSQEIPTRMAREEDKETRYAHSWPCLFQRGKSYPPRRYLRRAPSSTSLMNAEHVVVSTRAYISCIALTCDRAPSPTRMIHLCPLHPHRHLRIPCTIVFPCELNHGSTRIIMASKWASID